MPLPLRLSIPGLLLASLPGWANGPSPVGTWRTFDDGGHETGAVAIISDHGVLTGRVVAIADPAKAQGLCQHCPGDRADRPVMGLEVIRDLRPDGAAWDGGEILDPETGRLYRLKARLEEGGRKLVLRGYLGLSLFGRSQTWLRREAG